MRNAGRKCNLNRRIFFAALFIAIMAMSATYASPAAATANSSLAPQRNTAPFTLTLPPSMNYTIDGTLIAYVDASGYLLVTTNIPGFESINVTIRELYLGIKITVFCNKIQVNATTGKGGADVNVIADLTGRVNLYASIGNNNVSKIDSINKHHSELLRSSFFVPYGTNKTLTGLFPSFGPEETDSSTASADPLKINFTNQNVTSDGIQYSTVRHIQWDFSTWMEQKVNNTLNGLWSNFASDASAYIPGLQGGFNVVTSVGRVDIWKGNGTDVHSNPVNDILLAASELINLLVKFSIVGQGTMNLNVQNHNYSATYNINFHATFGLYFALTVTTDYFRTNNILGNNTIKTFLIQVPENSTLVWRNVTVIVYFGSPAHRVDVTAGGQRGNTTAGGGTLFFVDYGWDGVPDFATDGVGMTQLGNATGTVTGTGTSRTVTITKGSGTWVYFNLDITGYGIKDVKRDDGVTLNATQYWVNNGMLYVCDDPAYSYTVELIGGAAGGLSTGTLLLVGGAAAVIVIVALVVVMRRRSGTAGVSVKLV
jgi:hypothetical protein